MNILIVSNSTIPVNTYGGTERIIWWLGRELVRLGHRVTYLVLAGSSCPFANILTLDSTKDINQQIPDDIDVVHFHFPVYGFIKKPYLVTIHTNPAPQVELNENSVFLSANHAARYGASEYVYNGIDLADYQLPTLDKPRTYLHFLAKAAWRLKNVKGAINIATKSNNKLIVMGGTRLNIKMGFRFTPNLNVRFKGMVNNQQKSAVLSSSKALLFPVLWHEPFGVALIESMYFGCPVFGTPYGSLPELIPAGMGVLSNSRSALVKSLAQVNSFNNRHIHEYTADNFNINKMALQYLRLYERVLNNERLNEAKPVLIDANQPKFLPWND